MRRLIAVIVALLGFAVWGAAPHALASDPCGAAEQCTETDSTHNNQAQFDVITKWCDVYDFGTHITLDNRSVEVTNFQDDGQQHTYDIQIRAELPTNHLVKGIENVSIPWFGAFTWFPHIAPQAFEDKLYAYVQSGTGQVQRASQFHSEGDFPTWTQQDVTVGAIGAFSCA